MFGSKKAKEAIGSTPPASVAQMGSEPKASAGASRAPAARTPGSSGTASANEKAPAGAEALSPEEAQRRASIAIRQSLAFAQIISLLMRSPHYKHYSLADLEWLVLPPLLTGQFSVAEAGAKEGGPRVPVAVALWASVSAEVDKRLSENLTAPIRLRPDEWRSGDILWLVDAVGDARVVPGFLQQLGQNAFKGRKMKVRVAGGGGKPQVKDLSALQSPAAQKPGT